MDRNKRIALALLLLICLVSAVALSACMTSSMLVVKLNGNYEIYVDDDVEVLRPYLTVRYMDTSFKTTTVTDYDLDGEFVEAGWCNVTVSYQEVSKEIRVLVQGDDGITLDEDPYVNWTSAEFYSNYKPATSYADSYWRTKHNFMSGSIDNQNQAPTVASNQPKQGNTLLRNSADCYADNGNTWKVMDTNGNVVNKIYKGGAYITLEEVAAYVYAFGDIPANYDSNKNNKNASNSVWGKYLRVNHSSYSNNTTNYPYEPKLPESSTKGTLKYYELDIGGTGYNNGSSITRGTLRIVYTRQYSSGALITNLEDRYVFYTYNHYNDFQEYLNYRNGWGTRFGNVSNGGTLDKGSNPSPYVSVLRQDFSYFSL